MDAIISSALEEICSAGGSGLPLDSLWSRLSPSISLPLIPTVKQSIWTNLLEIPALHFLNSSKQPVAISTVQSFYHAETIGLVVVGKESLRDCFLGIYDLKAREGFKGFNADMLNVLNRLATARENGVTQCQLATEFNQGGNKIFYTLKSLESQGLISRKDAVIHKTGVSEGGVDCKIGITTKMVYLTRYAPNLGSQKRIEINQKKTSGCDGSDGSESGTNHDELVSEDVSVKDFIPAMKAICDKLGETEDKDLFVKDIKQALGYINRSSAHKEWRHICERLKDAGLVKEYSVTIDNKPFPRLRLLKAFSEKCFKTKSSKCDAEDFNVEPANNSTSEQVVELPIEYQIYYMVDAAGSKGITLIELCERLCINNKRYYNTFISTFFKYGMPCTEEGHNKGMTYRVWTSRNFDTDSLNAPSSKLDGIARGTNANLKSPDSASQYNTAITISESPHPSSNDLLPIAADREHVFERERPSHSSSKRDNISRTKPRENGSLTSCISETDQQLVAIEKTQATSNCSKIQPQHKDPKLTAIRERRICERLQEEKFMIKHELKCWLESLEEEKQSSMDSKTLDRILIKLQEQELCKCIRVGVPFSSYCTGQRLKDVVLHPSIQCTPEIYTQIQERLRCYDRDCRTRAKHKTNDESVDPVLDKVHEIPKKIVSDETGRMLKTLQANGFILSKIVRAKLLHIFLWDHLSGAPDQNDSISSGKPGYKVNDPHSTCKFFVMDDVIKGMPVELFYQVGGSTHKIDANTSSCMCLKDLPAHEYKSLTDRLAIGRLSRAFSVLRRLKLIRQDQEGGQLYAYEQYPYIEEPRTTFSTTSVRHNFDLQSRESVNDYWTTLESLYSTADEAAAAHAFPGSSVRELSNLRSWAPYQLTTGEKRAEFLKPNVTDDPNKKLSVKDCEKVLDQRPKVHFSSTSRKRKRCSKAKEGNARVDGRVDHEGDMNKFNSVGQSVEDANAFAAHNKEVDMNSMTYHESQQSEDNISPPFIEDDKDKHHPLVNQSFYPAQQIRFTWTGEAERDLVIQYARDHASRGPRFPRTEWTSIDNLPAHPDACKRKMALMRGNQNFRSALNKLLNILGERYVKYQEKKKSKLLTGGNHETLHKDPKSLDLPEQGDDTEEKWDDFDCEDIKTALDDALQLTQVFKHKKVDEGPQSNKKRRRKSSSGIPNRPRIPGKLVKAISKWGRVAKQAYESLAVSSAVELFKLVLLSTSTATEVPNIVRETLQKYSQDDLCAAFDYLREKKILVGGSGSSAYELSQQFLQRFSASPFPADTGTRASKFANWIHVKEDDLIGEGTDLTPDLECGDILELFSLVATGELSMTPCLPDDGVGEPEDSRILKHQGDDGELINESKAKKPKGSSIVDSEFNSRREKGFPGIKVSLNRTVFSSLSSMGISPDTKTCNEDDEYHQEGEKSECNSFSPDNLKVVLNSSHETCVLSDSNASPWDAMAEYTARLTLKSSDEESRRAFHPELFKDLYEAVKKAGDQGLTLNDISEFVDKQGNYLGGKMAKITIEVLQAFGLTVQVNAYDSVHIVDSLYRSKYLLTSVTSSSRAMQQSSECQVINDCARQKEQHAASGAAEYPLTETGDKNNHAHSVTILDHPAEVPSSSLTENPCSQDDTLVYQCSTSSSSCFPIVPWMNGDGTVNKTIYKGLVRRMMGAVMQNPGMLEDDIIRRMDVLNPQSCKKLMELLILENHLTVRKMRQARSNQPPTILGCLLKKNLNRQSENVIWREHFFANPASCHLL